MLPTSDARVLAIALFATHGVLDSVTTFLGWSRTFGAGSSSVEANPVLSSIFYRVQEAGADVPLLATYDVALAVTLAIKAIVVAVAAALLVVGWRWIEDAPASRAIVVGWIAIGALVATSNLVSWILA